MRELVRPHINREDILGKFATEDDFDILIDEDCDLYNLNHIDPNQKNEENVIFKFRKGVFTQEEQDLAYKGLREAAVQSQNRGMAAGPRGDVLGAEGRQNRDWVSSYQLDVLEYFMTPTAVIDKFPKKGDSPNDDTRGKVWLRSKVIGDKYGEYKGWFDRWVTRMHNQPKDVQQREAEEIYNLISETNYAQSVNSGIAGFFDRYPRIPYGRACGYNEKNPEKFELCFPYLRKLNSVFQKELPNRWGAQRAAADQIDPKFLIDETVFSTLTVNYNWRTAGHRDAGDLSEGFSNISGIGKGWKGCYFTLPEWNIGVNLQPGDLLLVSNHEGIHTNTAFENEDEADRVSVVAYFREKMKNLKSWEYESLRRQFVEERRKDKSHPLQRNQWNGVSPGMWDASEWHDFMKAHNMEDPYAESFNTLDEFF